MSNVIGFLGQTKYIVNDKRNLALPQACDAFGSLIQQNHQSQFLFVLLRLNRLHSRQEITINL